MQSYLYVTIGSCLIVFVNCLCGIAQTIPDGPYFGQDPPGMTPEVFARNIISLEGRYEYGIAFSPDGTECCFGVTDSVWSTCDLYYSKQIAGKWSHPTLAYFQNGYDGWTPFFTPDGKRLLFASGRPDLLIANIWESHKEDKGWSNPIKIDSPVNSESLEWKPTTANDGAFYFCSSRPGGSGEYDIYRLITSEKGQLTVENLGKQINSSSTDASPFISSDGQYLIFESWKEGGYGQADLYISYMKSDGSWNEPKNLGPIINTEQIEDAGYVSPDGKYFFFGRRQAWATNVATDIYWIDIRAVVSDTVGF